MDQKTAQIEMMWLTHEGREVPRDIQRTAAIDYEWEDYRIYAGLDLLERWPELNRAGDSTQ